jgi:hypothetical protein
MKILTFLFAFTFLNFTNDPSLDCKSIQEGVFNIPIDIEGYEGEYSRLTRTATHQIEYLSIDGSEHSFRVEWIDDCSYKLFDSKLLKGKETMPVNASDTLTVKIYNVTKDFYEATVSANFTDFVTDVKVLIVK